MDNTVGKIIYINGPVVKTEKSENLKMREMVFVGRKRLIGEVISIDRDVATIQVYEETTGLMRGEEIIPTGEPLSVKLGPGIISSIFDGIERPLLKMYGEGTTFIPEGIGLISIDEEKLWDVELMVKVGDILEGGQIYGRVQETSLIEHRLIVPPGVTGRVSFVEKNGSYNIERVLVRLDTEKGSRELKMYQMWPVRHPRPVKVGIR